MGGANEGARDPTASRGARDCPGLPAGQRGSMRFVHDSAWAPADEDGLAGRCWPGRCEDGNPRAEHAVLAQIDARTASLLEAGVELVAAAPAVQRLLRALRREGLSGVLSPEAVLTGAARGGGRGGSDGQYARALSAAGGVRLRGALTLPVRCTGLVERRGGPAGSAALEPRGGVPSDAAHVDQHRDGEPLRSMGVGALFRNVPWLRLLNVWTSLAPRVPVQPLAFVHPASVRPSDDLVRHRIWDNASRRLPTDVLFLRHSARHRWVAPSHLSHGELLIFDAMATPHGALRLPHEASLARLRGPLMRWVTGDADAPRPAECAAATALDRSVDASVAAHAALLDAACAPRTTTNATHQLRARIRANLVATERHSVEARCVAFVVPHGHAALAVALVGAAWCARARRDRGVRRRRPT